MHGTPQNSYVLTANLGALEIGSIHALHDATLEQQAGPNTFPPACRRIDDGALEATVGIAAAPTPTTPCMPPSFHCRRIDDATLEANGLMAGPPPTTPPNGCPLRPTMICPRIDDAALEAAGTTSTGPTSVHEGCAPRTLGCRIDDADMEAIGLSLAGPTPQGPCQMPPTILAAGCRRVDDAALEAAGTTGTGPTSVHEGCAPRTLGCRIDDDATLEASGLIAGPTPTSPGGGCGRFTSPPMCRHIDDAALEGTAGLLLGPTHYRGCVPYPAPTPVAGPILPRFSDATLEASALMAGPPSDIGCPRPTMIPPLCRRSDDDAALEASALIAGGPPATVSGAQCGLPPTLIGPGCLRPRIDDDATLEANGLTAGPPPTQYGFGCRHVDDATLEAASGSAGPSTVYPVCAVERDDAALEAAGGLWAGPTSINSPTACTPWQCGRHIDDDAELEASGGLWAGATSQIHMPTCSYRCHH